MRTQSFADRINFVVAEYWLPIGWIALLTGLFWIGDRGAYPRLFYWLVAAPAVLMMLKNTSYTIRLLRSPIMTVYTLFGLYVIATIGWSSADDSFASLAKRPLYVFLLLMAAGMLAQVAAERFWYSLRISAYIASVAGVVTLGFYYSGDAAERLPGYGALHNPLLSSHVYGFFWVLWLVMWIQRGHVLDAASLLSLCVLGTALIETGSRTPMVAVLFSVLWLAATHRKKLSAYIAAGLAATIALVVFFMHEDLMSRGLSHRPAIWLHVWQHVLEHPWFGHGFEASLVVNIPGLGFSLSDPHNIPLAVLYYTGVVGLAFWIALYVLAFSFAWRHRYDPMVNLAATLLMFGLAASLTEGGSFISRPKEHWFLIWIPLALLIAARVRIDQRPRDDAAI